MAPTEYQQLVEFLGRQFTQIDGRFTEIDRRFAEVRGDITGLRDDLADLRREMLGHAASRRDPPTRGRAARSWSAISPS